VIAHTSRGRRWHRPFVVAQAWILTGCSQVSAGAPSRGRSEGLIGEPHKGEYEETDRKCPNTSVICYNKGPRLMPTKWPRQMVTRVPELPFACVWF